jgi:hypothetical protein
MPKLSRIPSLRLALFIGFALALALGTRIRTALVAQQQQDPLAEAFKGVTRDGTVMTGLFPIRATGVSTAPVKAAAETFLASLNMEQRDRTTFPVDDIEWRKWNNVHRYARDGMSFDEMTPAQRETAFALLRASLSAKGFETPGQHRASWPTSTVRPTPTRPTR